jgi:hypothetical protein
MNQLLTNCLTYNISARTAQKYLSFVVVELLLSRLLGCQLDRYAANA